MTLTDLGPAEIDRFFFFNKYRNFYFDNFPNVLISLCT